MLHPHLLSGEKQGVPPLFAADDPISTIPDLQPIIHDFEHYRPQNQRRQQKKRQDPPTEIPTTRKSPDDDHHVDDYA